MTSIKTALLIINAPLLVLVLLNLSRTIGPQLRADLETLRDLLSGADAQKAKATLWQMILMAALPAYVFMLIVGAGVALAVVQGG